MLLFVAALAVAISATGLYVATVGWACCPSRGSVFKKGGWLVSSLVVSCSPCLVPVGSIWRLASSLVAIALLVKLYDSLHSSQRVSPDRLVSRLSWFGNFFWLVRRLPPPDHNRRFDCDRLSTLGTEAAAGIALLWGVFRMDWGSRPFFVEHCAKATSTFLVVVALSQLAAVTWRLAGGRAWDPMRAPLAATTPADFWRRWNRPAQQFFSCYMFDPVGRSHNRIAATLATFLVSGVVHEYVFGIAAGRVLGWQLLFFLIQGIAVVATQQMRTALRPRLTGQVATIAFNLVTSILFFRSMNDVLPFYVLRA
jgi:hypothetical protein